MRGAKRRCLWSHTLTALKFELWYNYLSLHHDAVKQSWPHPCMRVLVLDLRTHRSSESCTCWLHSWPHSVFCESGRQEVECQLLMRQVVLVDCQSDCFSQKLQLSLEYQTQRSCWCSCMVVHFFGVQFQFFLPECMFCFDLDISEEALSLQPNLYYQSVARQTQKLTCK